MAIKPSTLLLSLAAALAALTGLPARAQDVRDGTETVRRAIHVCASCHGEGGRSLTQGVPSLAGQMRQYTIAQLKDFRAQTRAEAGSKAYMWGISALLDDEAVAGLADYYAAQAPAKGKPVSAALVRAGRSVYVAGAPGRGVKACAACHGDAAEGQAGFPRLAGQRAEYVEAQLKGFGGNLRPHGVIMKAEAKGLSAAERHAVSAYLQSL